MGGYALRFRRRAADCRLLIQSARHERDKQLLGEMADDLDAEADRLDEEEAKLAGDQTEL